MNDQYWTINKRNFVNILQTNNTNKSQLHSKLPMLITSLGTESKPLVQKKREKEKRIGKQDAEGITVRILMNNDIQTINLQEKARLG